MNNQNLKSEKLTMTLRVRLILIVLIAIIPALLLMLDTAVDNYNNQISDAQNEVLQHARLAIKYHDTLISETHQLLTILEHLPPIQDATYIGCDQILEKMLFGNLPYANFGVIRPDGKVECSAVLLKASTNLADRSYFQTAIKSKKITIGNYQIGRIVDKPVQVIAKPILDNHLDAQSVIYASLNLDWLKRLVPVTTLPANSSITIIDRLGTILVRDPDPDNSWMGVNLYDEMPGIRHFVDSKAEEELTETYGVDGIHRIYALARFGSIENSFGYILVGIPSSPIYTAIKAHLLPKLLLIGITIVSIILLGWFGSEILILKRTRMLTNLTRKIGDGNYSERAVVEGNDEIAQLSREFNAMAIKLQNDNAKIKRLNRIHGVLSGINGAILRIRDRDALLQEACRIAVEYGDLQLAWIGLTNSESGLIDKVAWFGEGESYLHDHCMPSCENITEWRYPCASAIQSGSPVICNNIEGESSSDPWIKHALDKGFISVAAFPLHLHDHTIGVLGLYSNEKNFFADQETELFLELAADISLGLEYIYKDQRVTSLLYYDALTGLPNRKLCEDRLQQAIARASHHKRFVAIVVVNICGFRRLIGVYGNYIADEILNFIGSHLKNQVRDGDTVARLDGDEFAIILNDLATMTDAMDISRALISGIPSSICSADHDIHLGMRGGISIYPNDGDDALNLLGHAIFVASEKNAHGVHSINFYSTEIQESAHQRERIQQALRHAIESGTELELHYQPVIEIATSKIISFEALARWNNPNLGSVSPIQFIPIAEETGLILSLGEWALATACQQIANWNNLGFSNIRIAVNVAYSQFHDPDFIKHLDHIINNIPGCQHNQIGIEITESELMDNVETTVSMLKTLKARHMHCYLDDFGTGYSSLSYLYNLPLDILKIDKSFINNLGSGGHCVAIVRTIIALAKSLNLKTIAEGVETVEQLELLRQLGCDYIQGYLYSRPKPAVEFIDLLADGVIMPSVH